MNAPIYPPAFILPTLKKAIADALDVKRQLHAVLGETPAVGRLDEIMLKIQACAEQLDRTDRAIATTMQPELHDNNA